MALVPFYFHTTGFMDTATLTCPGNLQSLSFPNLPRATQLAGLPRALWGWLIWAQALGKPLHTGTTVSDSSSRLYWLK